MTANTPVAPIRRFVPADLDVADWAQLEPLYADLFHRGLGTDDALEAFLQDFSELSAVVSEYGSRRAIDHSRHTDDAELEQAYMHVVRELQPKIKPWVDKLQRRLLESPGLPTLLENQPRLTMLEREWRNAVELFREDNVPLEAELATLASEYDKLVGKMLVEYDGKTQTLQQLARYQDETDRDVREATWRLSTSRRLEDRDAVEAIFEKQLGLRKQVAANAGFADYRDYAWRDRERFDYTPADCEAFHDAVEAVVLPRLREIDQQRRAALGVE